MTDITLKTIASGYNLSKINDNFGELEAVINTEMIHTIGGNNIMRQDFDLNSNRVLNTPNPEDPLDLIRLKDLLAVTGPVEGFLAASIDIRQLGVGIRITQSDLDVAIIYAKDNGVTLTAHGTHYLDEDIYIDVNFDFSAAHFYSDYTFHVGRADYAQVKNIHFNSPLVIEPETDQQNVTFKNSTGIKCVNLQECVGIINEVGNNMVGQGALGGGYEVGLHVLAKQPIDDTSSIGNCSNNKFYLNYLNNNRVNLYGSEESFNYDPEVLAFKYAFANENLFIGGTWYLRTQLSPWANCHHILLDQVSSWTFYKPNLEISGNGVNWATLDIVKVIGGFNSSGDSLGGDENKFYDCRTEGGDPVGGNPLTVTLDGCLNTVFETTSKSFGINLVETNSNGNGNGAYNKLIRETQFGSAAGVHYPEVIWNELDDDRPISEYISGTNGNRWNRAGLDDDWTRREYHDRTAYKGQSATKAQFEIGTSFARRHIQLSKVGGLKKVTAIYGTPIGATIASDGIELAVVPDFIFQLRDDDSLGVHRLKVEWSMLNDNGKFAYGTTDSVLAYAGTGDYTVLASTVTVHPGSTLTTPSFDINEFTGSTNIPAFTASATDAAATASPLKISAFVTMGTNFTEDL
tara:strand:- start:3294 stop:5186 length:1893 start_codon:yes stop_codon:yes gene_type:complete